MHSLIYISSAVDKLTLDGMEDLLTVSRRNNLEHEITGLLVLKDYVIVQYIEGEEKAIKELFDKIKKDTRHFDVTLLKEEKIEKRLFEDWSMGFKNYSELDEMELELIRNFNYEDIKHLPLVFQNLINSGNN